MTTRNKTLADMGEYEFIRRIRGMMPAEGGEIVRSVGDDCLVVKSPVKRHLLLTTDTFVDSVHFDPAYSGYNEIGARCMAASVSDIAAMAGFPMYSLVSLSMPRTLLFDDAVALFTGLKTSADEYDCPIAGGETTGTPGPLTITVTVVGKGSSSKTMYRRGAKPGDGIFVTGSTGDAMGGLMAFRNGEKGYDSLKEKFLAPTALVTLARSLAEIYKVSALIDTSDGIATDIGHICEESGCGAEINETALPISADLRKLLAKHKVGVPEFALTAGEDYELLFTAVDKTLGTSFRFMNRTITRIGTITNGSTVVVKKADGSSVPLTMKGYEHFTL
jgi:thiamine-monophosphate kinase